MRITFKFTTAGEKGLASIPTIEGDGSQYADAHGMLDEAKARRSLANTPGIQFSDGDTTATIAFAIELLARIKQSFMCIKTAQVEFKNPRDKTKHPKTTCEKRMERGSVTFVRIDIRRVSCAIKATISTSNPREVVGHAAEMARYAAQAFTDNIVAIRDDVRGNGSAIIIAEGEGCDGMVARAEKRNEITLLRAKWNNCGHRLNGYCSPCVFKCPFFMNGNCTWNNDLG